MEREESLPRHSINIPNGHSHSLLMVSHIVVVVVSIIWLCRLRCHLFRGFLLEFCECSSLCRWCVSAAEWTTNNIVRSVVSLFVSEHRDIPLHHCVDWLHTSSLSPFAYVGGEIILHFISLPLVSSSTTRANNNSQSVSSSKSRLLSAEISKNFYSYLFHGCCHDDHVIAVSR